MGTGTAVDEVVGRYLGLRDGAHHFEADDGTILTLPAVPMLGLRLAGHEGRRVGVDPETGKVYYSPWGLGHLTP